MNTLAFDLTGAEVCAGLRFGERKLSRVARESRSSEKLTGFILDLLEETSLQPSQLDRIVTFSGPGSFSGIRAGLAAGLALQRTSGCKFTVFPSLLIACFEQQATQVEVISGANREEYYAVSYELQFENSQLNRILKKSEIKAVPRDSVNGSGVVNIDSFSSQRRLEAMFYLARLGQLPDLQERNSSTEQAPEPLYIKAVNAKTLAERASLKSS